MERGGGRSGGGGGRGKGSGGGGGGAKGGGGGYEEAEENLVEVAKAVKVVELELVVEEDERKERTGCRGRGRVSSEEGQDRTIVRGRRKKKMKLMQTRNARK